MKCRKCLKLLPLFAGGDLAPDDAARIAEHLAACTACAAECECMRGSVSVLTAAGVREQDLPAHDPAYWTEVESKLRSRRLDVEHLHAQRFGGWHAGRVLAQAALVLIVASGVVWFGVFRKERAQPPKEEVATFEKPEAEPPRFVLIHPRGNLAGGEVTTVPASAEVQYSDTGMVDRPAERQRIREMVVPVSDDGPF